MMIPKSQERLPTLSVVVATRDRPDVLSACLEAARQQQYPGLDLVVVDSAPRRATAREVASRFDAQYVHVARPDASRARNVGARTATGSLILFLDDDAVPAPDCFRAIVEGFRDTRVMAVTGRTLLAAGDAQVDDAFTASGAFDPGPTGRVIDESTPGWFEMVNFGGLGAGAVMAFRRAAFEFWPGFDERLGRGAPQDCNEEPHAYLALVERGYRVSYVPKAMVYHPGPSTFQELRRRHVRDAAWAAAYMSLLLVERPAYRGAVLRYAWEALWGRRRAWRPKPAVARHASVPRWQERVAWSVGPLLYLRMRLRVAISRLGMP